MISCCRWLDQEFGILNELANVAVCSQYATVQEFDNFVQICLVGGCSILCIKVVLSDNDLQRSHSASQVVHANFGPALTTGKSPSLQCLTRIPANQHLFEWNLLHQLVVIHHLQHYVQDNIRSSHLLGSVLDVSMEVIEAFSISLKGFLVDFPDGSRLVDLGLFAPFVIKQFLNC